jgi:hypothetical protein
MGALSQGLKLFIDGGAGIAALLKKHLVRQKKIFIFLMSQNVDFRY